MSPISKSEGTSCASLVEEEPHFQSEEQQFFVDELGESAITVGLRAWVRNGKLLAGQMGK